MNLSPQAGETPRLDLTRRNLLWNIAYLFSGSLVAKGVGAVTLLLTARYLGPSAYGQYTASLALAGLASIAFGLGLDIWLLREGGREPARLPDLAGSVLVIKKMGGLVWLGLVALAAPFLNQESYPAGILWLCAFSIWGESLFSTLLTEFKTALRSRLPSLLDAGMNIAWLAATVALVYLQSRRTENFVLSRVAVMFLAVGLTLYLAKRLVGLGRDRQLIQRALREAPPFAVSDFLGQVALRLDVVIVGFSLGKLAAGIYSPAVGLVNMTFLVPMAVYTIMTPTLSNLYATNLPQAKATARRTLWLLLAVGVGLAAAFYLASPLVIPLLGESYRQSLPLMRILSVILFFKCGSIALAAIIIASGQQARRTAVQAAAALVSLVGNLLVVHRFGVTGVAWIYVLAELVLLAGYAWLAGRKM